MKVKLLCTTVLSFVFVLIIRPTLFAQTEKVDTIFLKNGNVVTGKIKEYVPDKYLKIHTKEGLFFFQTIDITKLSIYSNQKSPSTPTDVSNNSSSVSQQVIAEDQVVDDVYFKRNNTFKSKSLAVNQSRFNDYFPERLFFIQGVADIDGIYEPFDVFWRYKVQGIYNRRISENKAFGAGMAYTMTSNNGSWPSLFLDYRTFEAKKYNFGSWSIDLGCSFTENYPVIYFNTAYNWGFRIEKNLFYTVGINFTHEKYNPGAFDYQGIFSNTSIGFCLGLMF